MDYIDLILCKEDSCLYKAPEFSMLNAGDKVIVSFMGKEIEKTVQDVMSLSTKSEEYEFILKMSGQPYPYKIIKKVTYKDFEFKDGDVNDQK